MELPVQKSACVNGIAVSKARLLLAPLIALSITLFMTPLQAQPWAPEPNVADDTGNWSSATFQELQIRLDGFRGYETTRVLDINAAKLHHPQHIVRLPNHVGADGKMHAYFAITHSNRFYREAKFSYYTDGYWMVAEIDADAYDAVTDQIIETPGPDGRYVYEEHFNNDRDEARKEYSDEIAAKGGQMVIALHGDWAHPAKMTAFDGILVMVGQNWSPISTVGDSLDAVLFYDVRDPVHPQFLGMLDSEELDIPGGNGDGGQDESWRKIDSIGLAKSPNGVYHLGVQGKNFFCHESQDCFINPTTPDKWVPQDVNPDQGSLGMAGGQGDVFQSWESYASVPDADEICFDAEGNDYYPGQTRPAECMPAGEYRTMWFEPIEDSVLPNDFDVTCDIIGKECNQGSENKMGLPSFSTLKYDSDPFLASETTLQATNHFAGKYSSGTKNVFMVQLWGDCAPSAGISVNDKNKPQIYCVSESDNEPIDCPGVAGECNRIWQNTAAAAPSYGAIKFTTTANESVIYRGRGLNKIADLTSPPWGPGAGKTDAVDWFNSQIKQIEVISGEWLIYTGPNFNWTGSGSVAHLVKGLHNWDPSVLIKSFRTVPEQGISLFERNTYSGRMVNNVRSNVDLSHTCGDNQEVCYAFAREDDCNIFGANCEHPRTFNDKASSILVGDGIWSVYQHDGWGGGSLTNVNRFNAGWEDGIIDLNDHDWNDEFSSIKLTTPCPAAPAKPTSLSYSLPEPGRPLITWSTDGNTDYYEIEEDIGNSTVFAESRETSRFMSSSVFDPGTYKFTVRGVRRESLACPGKAGPDSDTLFVVIPQVPVLLEIETSSTDVAGLGTGTVSASPAPTYQVGGNFYVPGDIVTLTAVPATRAEFDHWDGDAVSCGTTAICSLAIVEGAGMKALAIFRPKPSLIVASVGGGTRDANDEIIPGGTTTISPQGGTCSSFGDICQFYSTGTQVTLTASARAGRVFDSWRGDADCADGNVTMSSNLRCEALFKNTSYDLTVTQSPGVQVSSNPAGIDCGTGSDCEEIYQVSNGEQTVVLTAVIDPAYVFVRWSGLYDCWNEDEKDGDPLTARVTVGGRNVNCSVVAVPAGTEYALTIEKLGGGRVTAAAAPAADSSGIDCSSDSCSQSYPVNTVVTLMNEPSGGSEFVGFESPDAGSDDYSKEDDDCIDGKVSMIESISCVASFKTDILVVNGDYDSSSKEQNPYIGVLRNQELVDFEIWHVQNPNSGDNSTDPETGMRRVEPVAEDLAKFGRVIWYTGDASADRAETSPTAGPSAEAEASLAEYLDSGGCLLMSSPQYHKDRGLTPFMQNYLGVSSVTPDVEESYVKGAGSPSLGFSELTVDSFAGTASEGYFRIQSGGDFISDAVTHDPDTVPGSDVLFTYREGEGEAAVAVDNGIFRTAFFGFPFLGISSGDPRNNTMGAFLDFCGKPATDDLFEVNDDFSSATERTGAVALNALKILPDNDDFFRWQPDSDWFADTRFRITFKHATGDLALEVYDGDKQLLSAAQTQGDSEELVIAGASAGQTYYLRIYGVDGAGGNYKLMVERAGQNDFDQDGVSDAFDPLPFIFSEQFDTDRDYLGDNEDPDDDNDGMPDSYELQNGFDPLVANGDDDADGDGFSDVEEFWGETDPRDPNSTPGYTYEAPLSVSGFDIGIGAAGAWYNPATPGQGQLIDIEPVGKFMFLAWFAFTDEGSANPNQQHWFTAQGNYEGDTAQLTVYETLGGKFDDPAVVANSAVGTLQLKVTGCATAEADYSIDTWDATGSFDLARAVPGTENVCQEQSATTQAELVENDGWDGAWYDVVTPGQGFLIDVLPNATGDDFIFVAWFTYGDNAMSGQRWLTAQGSLIGNTAEITVYETTGGSFDDPAATTTTVVGTMTIEFNGCNAAVVTYSLTDEMLAGTIDIRRAIPGTEAFCDSLAITE